MPGSLTGTHDLADDLDSHTLSALGARVRELRGERKLTLAKLSLKSQISVGMLSHIERGQTSPSLKTLERLRMALDIPLASFFGPSETRGAEDGVVVRAARRATLPFDKIGLTKELLSPPGHSELDMLMLVIAPGGSSGSEPWRRSGEKAGLVLEGRFELTIGRQVYVIEENDSFQFDSRQPHSFRNLSDGQTRVLWIIKPDEPG
jgi:transcriptional regulator with XRE-family HTH domain